MSKNNKERENEQKHIVDAGNVLKARQNIEDIDFGETGIIEKPKGIWGHIKAYFYFYKLPIALIILLGAVVISITIAVLWPKQYDATFTYIAANDVSGCDDIITDALNKYAQDNTGDGKIDLKVDVLSLPYGQNTSITYEELQSNEAEAIVALSGSENFLYMLDEEIYNQVSDMGAEFVPISEIIPNSSEYQNIDGDKYYLKDTKLVDDMLLFDIFGESFLCIRKFDMSVLSEQDIEKYERDIALFKAIAEAELQK